MKDEKIVEKNERVQREEKYLRFWKEHSIFEKTLQKPAPQGEFVFYEGPPTANGKPGIHHLESRAFKDVIPRYKTMRGYRVQRKAGWDTHGLPVEIEVEKELGLKNKKEIEEYGIAPFNKKCKESVWKYVELWEKFSERAGYWTDMENPYITYEPDYMESLWWIISEIDKKGLLYKDYKVLPWCPRCGTALSSHELAQGYKDVKDISITAEFEVINGSHKELSSGIKTSILAWTTTPWTLPGNVALAVGKDIDYAIIEKEDEGGEGVVRFVLAKELLNKVFGDSKYEVVTTLKGSEIVGTEYKPLFPFLANIISEEQKDNLEKAYKVYEADFVTTEDGTGVVHTAVMYGHDDFELGTKVGLPKEHLINEKGEFLPGTGFLEGRFVKDLETEIEILKALQAKGALFAKAKYEHSYPHCWRCKTSLIYFARDSWYVRMTTLRDEMVASNQEISWEPAHLKEGRFGEWISGIKDWAFSRERYWGTPLPVWVSENGEEKLVVDSFETLKKHTPTSGNTYIVMRHGEAESNVEKIVSDNVDNPHHLTKNGKQEVVNTAEELSEMKVDYIITSPFIRTRETAEILAIRLGVPKENIIVDVRIQEIQTGGFNGKSHDEYHEEIKNHPDIFGASGEARETLLDVKKRMGDFLYDIETRYANSTILIVTHGSPSWMLFAAAYGFIEKELKQVDVIEHLSYLGNAEYRELSFVPLPHNENYERDLHRPYVDDHILLSSEGTPLKRVKEVVDVWFDSGSMPFAQHHYPFENKERVDQELFPADYISEAIDQTRGWFYTLHAVGVLLGKGRAYKNVISLGHLLDAEGKKMSKSIGNVVDPFVMMDTYGADILRMWMYSVNQPGDSKNFDERTVDEMSKKILNLLENIVHFYTLYSKEEGDSVLEDEYKGKNALDLWIIAKLKELNMVITSSLDEYKLFEPSRAIRDFIGDFSQWYIRRSRERFKSQPQDEGDRKEAILTTGYVLRELAKIIAPFMPFSAEYVYTSAGGPKESVHLEDWRTFTLSGEERDSIAQMNVVRSIASLGLEARDKVSIKVRQVLASLTIEGPLTSLIETIKNNNELLQLIKDEINVKDVFFEEGEGEMKVTLDTLITPDLKQEGEVREFVRAVQNIRKEKGLEPMDTIESMSVWGEEKDFIESYKGEIESQLRIKKIVFEEVKDGTTIEVGEKSFMLDLTL